jgi:hypothetical protein
MTLSSNKRLILLYTILVILPLIGLSTFRFLSPVWAIVCLGICLFLDRSLYRLAKPFLNSTIESLEDRIVISVPGYDAVEVAFNEVDLAGEFQIKGNQPCFCTKKEGISSTPCRMNIRDLTTYKPVFFSIAVRRNTCRECS